MVNLSSFETHSVVVERPAYTKDASGGARQAYSQVSSSALRCSLQPNHGASPHFFGQRQTVVTHLAYFSFDPGAQRGDRLKDTADNATYIVLAIENIAGRSELWCVELTRQNAAEAL